ATAEDAGGDWEDVSGLSKKEQKRQDKRLADEEEARMISAMTKKAIPGMGPASGNIPGMAPAKGASSQDIDARLKSVGSAATAALRAEAEEAAKKAANSTSVTINVPEAKIGVLIGPKGSTIKMIQEKSGVTRIDTSGEVFTIMGPPQAVAMAEHAIRELLEKGYTSMAFEDFREELIPLHPSVFPDLIGKQGCVIKALKTELGVEISIPEVPKNAAPGKKFKVSVAGSIAAVEKGKQVVLDIAMFGHSEATHPGVSHAEIEVPDWQYRFLIGKAGSELRHIQNNYKVKVNIPRDHSACQNVVVVGLEGDVERAQVYIEKVLWNAENQSKGRDREDKTIGDGYTEEPEEDWMKAYMYKR
ncbi:unnamed protein product, partial [Polarella glacialis]